MLYYNIAFKRFLAVLLVAFLSAFTAQISAKPLVVTSIKPLAIIVKSAFPQHVQVEYVMPAAQSPHDVVLKLSDIRTLSAADVVFWIGPDFEISAAKQFSAIAESKLVTAMHLIKREQMLLAGDSHEHDHHQHDLDPHIWLSPTLARQLVKNLSERLKLPAQEIFSVSAKKFTENLLVEVKKGRYIIHHQAFDYFIEEFGLRPGLPIRDMVGKQQGAKTQFNLRAEGERLGVSCVFIEPQHGHKDAMAVAKDLGVPIQTMDILAVDYQSELPSYESYIYGLAEQFSACFK